MWGAVAALAAWAAVIQVPAAVGTRAIWRWARTVDHRLDAIEARSYMRREGD